MFFFLSYSCDRTVNNEKKKNLFFFRANHPIVFRNYIIRHKIEILFLHHFPPHLLSLLTDQILKMITQSNDFIQVYLNVSPFLFSFSLSFHSFLLLRADNLMTIPQKWIDRNTERKVWEKKLKDINSSILVAFVKTLVSINALIIKIVRFNKYFSDTHCKERERERLYSVLRVALRFSLLPKRVAMENDTGCINFQEYILRTYRFSTW